MKVNRLRVENVGQIREADVTFKDLNVFVGPQATGKSIFLQLVKLIEDQSAVQAEFRGANVSWEKDPSVFMNLYFGDGMAGLFGKDSRMVVGNTEREWKGLSRGKVPKEPKETMFFIPAQRVMSLKEGQTRPFSDYRTGDPYTLRKFSGNLHALVQNEIGTEAGLFPKSNRLKADLRDLIAERLFGGFELRMETDRFQKRLVLKGGPEGRSLPFLVWSAGQREFVPLLLGLYWLMPPAATPRRGPVEWVVIEEPEMGLHPEAISTLLFLVLELLDRGYRVSVSTHSPHVLDSIWGLQFLQKHGGNAKDVVRLFGGDPRLARLRQIGESALGKRCGVHYFRRDGIVQDITSLDPGSEDKNVSGWGGLSEFSGRVGDVVSDVARRSEKGR